uniref:Secreted protein n=1 Tax=Macrostomum lignano TaxID=282301 RepID=A0A1I8GM26_9PLAT
MLPSLRNSARSRYSLFGVAIGWQTNFLSKFASLSRKPALLTATKSSSSSLSSKVGNSEPLANLQPLRDLPASTRRSVTPMK